jgi:hypothetical protein
MGESRRGLSRGERRRRRSHAEERWKKRCNSAVSDGIAGGAGTTPPTRVPLSSIASAAGAGLRTSTSSSASPIRPAPRSSTCAGRSSRGTGAVEVWAKPHGSSQVLLRPAGRREVLADPRGGRSDHVATALAQRASSPEARSESQSRHCPRAGDPDPPGLRANRVGPGQRAAAKARNRGSREAARSGAGLTAGAGPAICSRPPGCTLGQLLRASDREDPSARLSNRGDTGD